MAFPSNELSEQLNIALEGFLDDTNEENRTMSNKWIDEFYKSDIYQYIYYLAAVLGNPGCPETSRKLSAVFLYSALYHKDQEYQLKFAKQWVREAIEFRQHVCTAAQNGMSADNEQIAHNSANLMGLFLSIEFTGNPPRDQPNFNYVLEDLMVAAEQSPSPQVRIAALTTLMFFSIHCYEMNNACYRETQFMSLVNSLFSAFHAPMLDPTWPDVQLKAIECLTASLLVFTRHLSFDMVMDRLITTTLTFITADDLKFVIQGYGLLKKIVDHFYRYIQPYMEAIFNVTLNDISSDCPDRQIEASYLWHTVGQIEYSLQSGDKVALKPRHRDFNQCFNFCRTAFERIFPYLVDILLNTDETEISANTTIDRTAPHAAFSCLQMLIAASDGIVLTPILVFVEQNVGASDWRRRYSSLLLLNASWNVSSMQSQPSSILTAFNVFVNAIDDDVPRITEVALWSLGLMIETIPELVLEPERFQILTNSISRRITDSAEMMYRSFWLLRMCFSCFDPDDYTTPLVERFEEFSDLILTVADKYDVAAIDAAYGALNSLIEYTPCNLIIHYNALFEKVIMKLEGLLSGPSDYMSPLTVHNVCGLLSIAQAIVMNVRDDTSESATKLVELLIPRLHKANGDLVTDALPTLGAIARYTAPKFEEYLPTLIPMLIEYLSREEYVQPASVFTYDIYAIFGNLGDELDEQFIALLFAALDMENITKDARHSVLVALGEIAKKSEEKCLSWIDNYLMAIDTVSKSVLDPEDDKFDRPFANSFSVSILIEYQALNSIFTNVDNGHKKVRNFFPLLNRLDKINKYKSLESSVLMEVVVLIHQIASSFGRQINVYTNRTTVTNLLKSGCNSENPSLSELAEETLRLVKQ